MRILSFAPIMLFFVGCGVNGKGIGSDFVSGTGDEQSGGVGGEGPVPIAGSRGVGGRGGTAGMPVKGSGGLGGEGVGPVDTRMDPSVTDVARPMDVVATSVDTGRTDTPAAGDAPMGTAPLGAVCANPNSCASGLCVDGVCCETVCEGDCMACAMLRTNQPNGRCRPAKAGTDPHDDCSVETAFSCKTTGACNGLGSCALHAAGTICGTAACSMSTLTPASTCDGSGTCQSAASRLCAGGNRCDTSTTCRGRCMGPSDCGGALYCDLSDGVCKPRKTSGSACTMAAGGLDCATGSCVDGVCCESACPGSCMACAQNKTGKDNGKCAPVLADTDPDAECNEQDVSTCGTNGKCDGTGVCGKYPDDTACGTRCCTLNGEPHRCGLSCQAGKCDKRATNSVERCTDGASCSADTCTESGTTSVCHHETTCGGGGCCCKMGSGGSCKNGNSCVQQGGTCLVPS